MKIRPSTIFILCICCVALFCAILLKEQEIKVSERQLVDQDLKKIVSFLGVTDICVATDARYLRHLSVTDPVAPFMDDPRALEYFPSSSIVVPVN